VRADRRGGLQAMAAFEAGLELPEQHPHDDGRRPGGLHASQGDFLRCVDAAEG
jgi:hypothetical protein